MRRGPRLPLEQLQPYLLDVSEPREGVDRRNRIRQNSGRSPNPNSGEFGYQLKWDEVFGNDHPVEIEVGFGKGLFLINAGKARPETNFLGIEIERKYTLFTATRLAKRDLSNVK